MGLGIISSIQNIMILPPKHYDSHTTSMLKLYILFSYKSTNRMKNKFL
jgi:hypothetical protein